jgi:hypothetical protein
MVYPVRDRGGSQMSEARPEPNDADATGQVLLFRQRHRAARLPLRPAAEPIDAAIEPEDDLAQYEQDGRIDYRQRMLMNVIAVAICTMLVGVGVWIADTIAEMEKDQDCVLQGRINCASIEVPLPRRQ